MSVANDPSVRAECVKRRYPSTAATNAAASPAALAAHRDHVATSGAPRGAGLRTLLSATSPMTAKVLYHAVA
jgi:hypothetical protein